MPPSFLLRVPMSLKPVAWCAGLLAMGFIALPAGANTAAAAPGAALNAAEASFTYTSVAGDTLIGLGRRFLADPAQWPELQRINRVANPRRIPVGTALQIPLRLMVTEPVPARVLAASGDVRGADGQPLAAGQTVPQGGSLRTGDGQATVQLVDGTVLRLRPASELQVATSQRLPQVGAVQSGVQLQQGQVEVKAQKAANRGLPGFRLNTPQGVLGVRGTEFRVAVDGSAELTRGEVLEGQVATDGRAGQPGQLVDAGFGVVVDRTGTVAPPVKLLAAPDLAGLPGLQERPLVRFTVAPMPGAVAYRGQVAADASFEQVLADNRATGTELRFADLPDGRYILRVRGEDANGLQGLDAQHPFTLKARPEPPLPNAPTPRAVMTAGRVDFAWTTAQEASSYRLQIAQTEDFSQPLRDQRGLRQPALQLDGLAPGVYHWRLASERSASDQGPFGPVNRFELRAQPAPLPAPRIGEDGVRLAWTGLPGQSFELQFARDAAFTAPVLTHKTTATSLEATMPGTGRFHVRLRARDADGYQGPYTAPQQFDVPNCLRDGQRRCVVAGDAAWVLIAP